MPSVFSAARDVYKRQGLVRVSVAHAAKQAARKLRAVEPVFVLLRSLFIGGDTIREVEPAANERRMIPVSYTHLLAFAETAPMQRLRQVGMHCGCEYRCV